MNRKLTISDVRSSMDAGAGEIKKRARRQASIHLICGGITAWRDLFRSSTAIVGD